MKIYNNIIAFLFFFFLNICLLTAQKFVGDFRIGDEAQVHLIYLKNGKIKEGRILSIIDTQLMFFSLEKNETTTHHLSDLMKVSVKGAIDEIPEMEELEAKGLNRLFYQETGFTLPAGEVDYTTYWGIIHRIEYGLTDGFTIGAGMVYPGYIMLSTKFNISNTSRMRRFKMGFHIDAAGKPLKIFDNFLGKDVTRWKGFMRFGCYTTFGQPDRNVHVGLNVIPLFDGNDFFGFNTVFGFNFGGTIRVAKHWRVIYENMFGADFNTDGGLFTGIGVSWFDKRNVIKFGIKPNSFFGFFNFPVTDTNLMHRLPVLSYSRSL